MSSMTKYARKALLDRYDASVRMKFNVYPSLPGAPQSSLTSALSQLLHSLVAKERVQGLQVCVVQGGAVVADLAAGSMGLLDPRPVTPTTLFPCLAVSRIAAAAIVNALAESRLLCTCRDGC